MALPKISLPLSNIEIPSTGFKTTFRPFTVKDEKILLIAKESKDIDQIILSIKQVLQNCITDIDADELSTFDVEYLMLKVRSSSVSEMIEFTITDPDTNEDVDLKLNLNDVKIIKDEKHTNKIMLEQNYQVIMKYPSFDQMKAIIENGESETALLVALSKCIDKIIVDDSVYDLGEASEEDIAEFFDGLTKSHIEKIQEFFETMPKLQHAIKYVNSNGDDKVFVIEGTQSFFI